MFMVLTQMTPKHKEEDGVQQAKGSMTKGTAHNHHTNTRPTLAQPASLGHPLTGMEGGPLGNAQPVELKATTEVTAWPWKITNCGVPDATGTTTAMLHASSYDALAQPGTLTITTPTLPPIHLLTTQCQLQQNLTTKPGHHLCLQPTATLMSHT